MADILRYGVFQMGRIWSVVSGDGHTVGFPTRGRAIAAPRTLASVHQACGQPSEVLAQDERGRLEPVRLRRSPADDYFEEPRQEADAMTVAWP